VLRFEAREQGQAALPAIDLDDAVIVIGSGPAARIRLPANAAKAEQVRIERGAWHGEAAIDGVACTGGEIGEGITLELGNYRLRVAPAPVGSLPTTPQRTESLARELVRSMLGAGAAPSLEVERGPTAGVKRALAPPVSTLVIGRGDEATWVILDGDLSKTHAEIRRGWDGIRIVDLDSKNGTKIDGVRVHDAVLSDGAVIELGKVRIKFRDPAERHLLGGTPALPAPPSPLPSPSVSNAPGPRRSTALVFYVALAIMVLALAGLVWALSA
jgi:hypothetical protein